MFFIFICKHFNSFLVFNLCISRKVRLNFLLVARYFLLVCSLLVTFCSLLVTFYLLLVARYFLLVARPLLLFTRCSLLVTFCSFARCLVWNNITVSREKMVWLLRNSTTNIFVANLWDFCNFFWMVIFKVFSTCKTIFKVGIKSQTLDITWCIY